MIRPRVEKDVIKASGRNFRSSKRRAAQPLMVRDLYGFRPNERSERAVPAKTGFDSSGPASALFEGNVYFLRTFALNGVGTRARVVGGCTP